MSEFHKSCLLPPSSQDQSLYSHAGTSGQGAASPDQQVTGSDLMWLGIELGNELVPTTCLFIFLLGSYIFLVLLDKVSKIKLHINKISSDCF